MLGKAHILGKTLYGYPDDVDSAQAVVLSVADSAVSSEYWKYTRTPCRQANVYYDELTDHGKNDMDSEQALQKAIERFEPQMPE